MLLSHKQVMWGSFKGDLQYHEVPLEETLLSPAGVGRFFMTGVPTIDPGVRHVSLVQPGLMGFSISPRSKN